MENIAYYNGKISSIEEMMIPMNERSSYFGDGVYDAMFTVEHVPLQLDDHLRRFYRSAERIDIRIPMPFDELRALVLDFCRRDDSPDAMAYVRRRAAWACAAMPTAFAGEKPSLWVWVKPDSLDPLDRSSRCITCEVPFFPLRYQDDQPSAQRALHPARGGARLRGGHPAQGKPRDRMRATPMCIF